MKVTYVDEVETRSAFSRKMWCPKCGNHYFEVVHQVKPAAMLNWYVRCPECEFETPSAATREIALVLWKQEGKY